MYSSLITFVAEDIDHICSRRRRLYLFDCCLGWNHKKLPDKSDVRQKHIYCTNLYKDPEKLNLKNSNAKNLTADKFSSCDTFRRNGFPNICLFQGDIWDLACYASQKGWRIHWFQTVRLHDIDSATRILDDQMELSKKSNKQVRTVWLVKGPNTCLAYSNLPSILLFPCHHAKPGLGRTFL